METLPLNERANRAKMLLCALRANHKTTATFINLPTRYWPVPAFERAVWGRMEDGAGWQRGAENDTW